VGGESRKTAQGVDVGWARVSGILGASGVAGSFGATGAGEDLGRPNKVSRLALCMPREPYRGARHIRSKSLSRDDRIHRPARMT
jgi:hypothetical protein